MSEITNIVSLYEEFKTDKEKKNFIEAQYRTTLALLSENKRLKEELQQLKLNLSERSLTKVSTKIETIIISPEEAICDTQIAILQNKGMMEELTLEEIKKFDLLMKNKNLIKEKPTMIGEFKKLEKHVTEAELLQIASSVDSKDS